MCLSFSRWGLCKTSTLFFVSTFLFIARDPPKKRATTAKSNDEEVDARWTLSLGPSNCLGGKRAAQRSRLGLLVTG